MGLTKKHFFDWVLKTIPYVYTNCKPNNQSFNPFTAEDGALFLIENCCLWAISSSSTEVGDRRSKLRSSTKNRGHYITNITNSNKALLRGNHLKLPSLRIEICPKKGISTIISTLLFWGWDWDHQSYSREGSRFLGHTFASTLISPKWVVWSLFQLLQVSKSAPKESRSLENKNTSRGQVTSKSSQRCEGTKEGSKTGLKTWAKQKIANPNNQQFDTSNWTCWISRG